jgi:NAD(P)-dependent dehydrogenase (short-subunit alcohol dehydrogenase family)
MEAFVTHYGAMSDPSSKLAVITGAASGLGRAFCRQVIAVPGNWHIVAVDIDEAGAQQTLAEVRQTGRVDGEFAKLDVSDGDGWVALRERLQRNWPRLDLLINNAGVCLSAEVGEGSLDAWRRVFDVNYFGVLNGCHTMAPWLKMPVTSPQRVALGDSRSSEGSGLTPNPAIVNIASIMGLLPAPALGAYSASKAAVIALSESMYAELRPHGVNVTVAAPGFFDSPLLDNGVFASRRHREQADEWVRTSRIDADAVARKTLQASRRGQLYAVVGSRARWYWRLKRSAPTLLLNTLSRRYQRMMKPHDGDTELAD